MDSRITKAAGICGGRACIAGHRIRVADVVVWHERRGYSADEVVGMFPGISLGDVHAALAYYFDHRSEIEGDIAADAAWAAQVSNGSSSKLREKLGA